MDRRKGRREAAATPAHDFPLITHTTDIHLLPKYSYCLLAGSTLLFLVSHNEYEEQHIGCSHTHTKKSARCRGREGTQPTHTHTHTINKTTNLTSLFSPLTYTHTHINRQPTTNIIYTSHGVPCFSLEVRAAGTCQDLQLLRGNCLEHGSVELRTRLVFLPSVTGFPPLEWNLDFAMAVKEVGAPHLERLWVTGNLPPLVDAIASMCKSENLNLSRSSLSGTSCYHFLALMQRYTQSFLPYLVELVMQYPFR